MRFLSVQAERLELSHLAALDPKSSVSTNSTTPATKAEILFQLSDCKYKHSSEFAKRNRRNFSIFECAKKYTCQTSKTI